jgi:hypothetical protein
MRDFLYGALAVILLFSSGLYADQAAMLGSKPTQATVEQPEINEQTELVVDESRPTEEIEEDEAEQEEAEQDSLANLEALQLKSEQAVSQFTGYQKSWQKRYQQLEKSNFPRADVMVAVLELNEIFASLNRSSFVHSRSQVVTLNDNQWKRLELAYQQQWQAYLQLLGIREQFLHHLDSRQRSQLFSFGPEGVRQIKLESKLLLLNFYQQVSTYQRRFVNLLRDSFVSPVPVIIAIGKLFVLLLFIAFWRQHVFLAVQQFVRQRHQSLKSDLLLPLAKFYLALHKSLVLAVLLYGLISIATSLFQPVFLVLMMNIYLHVITALFVMAVNQFFLASEKRKVREVEIASVNLLVKFTLAYVLVSDVLYGMYIGNGVIANRFALLMLLLLALVIVLIIKRCKPLVLALCKERQYEDDWLAKKSTYFAVGPKSYAFTLLALLYFPLLTLLKRLLLKASNVESVNLWMSYLFRVEVARQHAKSQELFDLDNITEDQAHCFTPDFNSSSVYGDIAETLIAQVEKLALARKASISLIHAVKGAGKSAFMQRLVKSEVLQADHFKTLYIDCPVGGFAELMENMAIHFALDKELNEGEELNGARAVVSYLKETEQMLICIDNIHHLIQPSIGGLQELDRLVRLMRRASSNIAWVISMDSAAWRFVERARGERFLFDLEERLPRWKEADIAKLIADRLDESGLRIDLSYLVLPKQLDNNEEMDDELTVSRYAKILWEYAGGNPGIALELWRQSLYLPVSESSNYDAVLRLFDISENTELERLSVNLLLILRAIMQMEYAQKDSIAKAANLSSDEVIDALRLLRSKGFVVKNNNDYAISWHCYRDVETVLKRQHLLVM